MNDYSPKALNDFKQTKSFFIGFDSDGCVFDTMELKQKECFTPMVVKMFNLQSISKYTREVADFVNLYSKWRGTNRFIALIKDFEFLEKRPEVVKRGTKLPDISSLREWTANETKLGNIALEEHLKNNDDQFLSLCLEWSLGVNQVIAGMVKGIGPFPLVRETMEKAKEKADLIVVSQTPCEALFREWKEHDLDKYPAVIAGQEMGSKSEHLQLATRGQYPPERMLVVGDAPGDLKAAKSVQAHFFPILPGEEEQSWERLHNEALDLFFDGKYQGDYEDSLLEDFDRHLPASPPWGGSN